MSDDPKPIGVDADGTVVLAALPGETSPSGDWQMAPRMPTEEMIDRACAAWIDLHPAFKGEKPEPTAGDVVSAAYRAMLAAAPPEPQEGSGTADYEDLARDALKTLRDYHDSEASAAEAFGAFDSAQHHGAKSEAAKAALTIINGPPDHPAPAPSGDLLFDLVRDTEGHIVGEVRPAVPSDYLRNGAFDLAKVIALATGDTEAANAVMEIAPDAIATFTASQVDAAVRAINRAVCAAFGRPVTEAGSFGFDPEFNIEMLCRWVAAERDAQRERADTAEAERGALDRLCAERFDEIAELQHELTLSNGRAEAAPSDLRKFVFRTNTLMDEVLNKGLVYWEPKTEPGRVNRADMVARIERYLTEGRELLALDQTAAEDPVPADEGGWIIEKADVGLPTRYFSRDKLWLLDKADAMRFATRQLAADYIRTSRSPIFPSHVQPSLAPEPDHG